MLRDKRASEVFFSLNKGVDEERVSHQANIADGSRGDDPAVLRANYEIGATNVGTVRASRAISRDSRRDPKARSLGYRHIGLRPPRASHPSRPSSIATNENTKTHAPARDAAAATGGAGERTRCCRMSRQRIRADSQGAGAKKLPRFRD